MRHTLIIEGQQVDLSNDLDITLEYVSNLFNSSIGQLHLSRSYTIKLPKTLKNARILDDPGNPGHASQKTRRYLSAQYLRNGIDLIGEGQAHILSSTDEEYEVALVWNTVPNLAAWYNGKKKLNELTGLGRVLWSGAPLATMNTTSGVFFAKYDSGLGPYSYPTVNAAPHPSVTMYELLTRSFQDAGIPYRISSTVEHILRSHALLVAPSHKPDKTMEIASGSSASGITLNTITGYGTRWRFRGWTHGWDAPMAASNTAETNMIQKGTTKELRIVLNLRITNASPDIYLALTHSGKSVELLPTQTDDGGYIIDTVVDLEDELEMTGEAEYCSLEIKGLEDSRTYTFQRYDTAFPIFAAIRPHEQINIAKQNEFPIADNLPNITQYDLMKGLMGVFGLSAVPRGGILYLDAYDNILFHRQAVDWSAKVDMANGDGIRNIEFSLKGFAKQNRIIYEQDVTIVNGSPDIVLLCDDETLDESKDLLKLPFAASNGGAALHYKYSDASDSSGQYYVNLETVDIKPRIFGFVYGSDYVRRLTFSGLGGKDAVSEYLARYQRIIKNPILLEANIRLNEMDLAGLDFTRPVYLAQYGQYYAVLKVQTSDTDLCKVELIQIP